MLVFLVGPTKASKDIATSNWTQVQTQAAKRTQGRTQAAKGTRGSETDASADASSKSDARQMAESADATGRKCRRK